MGDPRREPLQRHVVLHPLVARLRLRTHARAMHAALMVAGPPWTLRWSTRHYQAGTLMYKIPARIPSGPAWAKQARATRLGQLRKLLPAVRERECYWDDCARRGRHVGPFEQFLS